LRKSSTCVRTISPDEKGNISIETVRELYKAARTKQEDRQAIIIERIDQMSLEAENAFLKLLEEPRQGLTFVLTALQLESLLPTIRSRVQHLNLQPLPDDAIRRHVMAKNPAISQNNLSQIVFIANGRPGTAMGLLNDKAALSKQRERIQLAKQLVTAKPYDRFVQINRLATDRDNCLATLNAMMRIVEVQINSTADAPQLRRWSQIANALESALGAITNNGNMRAQLLLLLSSY
jgi:DNA polymerase III gamma/tau subunit